MRINSVVVNDVKSLYIMKQVSMSEKGGGGLVSLVKFFDSCFSRLCSVMLS